MSHSRFRYLRRFIVRVHDDILMAFVLGLLHVLFSPFFFWGGGGEGGLKGQPAEKERIRLYIPFLYHNVIFWSIEYSQVPPPDLLSPSLFQHYTHGSLVVSFIILLKVSDLTDLGSRIRVNFCDLRHTRNFQISNFL